MYFLTLQVVCEIKVSTSSYIIINSMQPNLPILYGGYFISHSSIFRIFLQTCNLEKETRRADCELLYNWYLIKTHKYISLLSLPGSHVGRSA